MKHMNRYILTLMVGTLLSAAGRAQEATEFPYPTLPDSLTSPHDRLAWMLENFWSNYSFSDTTQTNRQTGEQGFVDFINLMQHADSAVCTRSARSFAQHITGKPSPFFEELTEHYLGSPRSPMRNDVVYAHLLRALPPTTSRTFLLQEVSRNQVGMMAADIPLDPQETGAKRLHEVQSELTLLVFHDPACEHCQEVLPMIKQSAVLKANSQRLRVVFVNTEKNTDAQKAYYLPELPALYLLDRQKRVLVKNGSLEETENYLNSSLER